MLATPLALDVAAIILEYLHDDVRTLKSCALVSRSLQRLAYKQIFAQLRPLSPSSIIGIPNYHVNRLKTLHYFLNQYRYLRYAVKSFTVSAARDPMNEPGDPWPIFQHVPQLLMNMLQLQSLNIVMDPIRQSDTFNHTIAAKVEGTFLDLASKTMPLPDLRQLQLKGVWPFELCSRILKLTDDRLKILELTNLGSEILLQNDRVSRIQSFFEEDRELFSGVKRITLGRDSDAMIIALSQIPRNMFKSALSFRASPCTLSGVSAMWKVVEGMKKTLVGLHWLDVSKMSATVAAGLPDALATLSLGSLEQLQVLKITIPISNTSSPNVSQFPHPDSWATFFRTARKGNHIRQIDLTFHFLKDSVPAVEGGRSWLDMLDEYFPRDHQRVSDMDVVIKAVTDSAIYPTLQRLNITLCVPTSVSSATPRVSCYVSNGVCVSPNYIYCYGRDIRRRVTPSPPRKELVISHEFVPFHTS